MPDGWEPPGAVSREPPLASFWVFSVARIFFRNAINVGLPVFECDTSLIEAEDSLRIDVLKGVVENLSKGTSLPFLALPQIMVDILNDGGLTNHIQKHGGFNL